MVAGGFPASVPVTLTAAGAGPVQATLAMLCTLVLLLVAVTPPLMARALSRGRRP